MATKRLAVLDVARGLAVVAMVIYHFSWDLYWFAFVDWPVAEGTGWKTFAGMIAGSFLFLAGVSLDLAHHETIRWSSFWRRFFLIAAAAAGVTLVTYFTFGSSFVRFGILHCIAAASLVALPFIGRPFWFAVVGAVFLVTLPIWAGSPFFDGQAWLWTGLGTPLFGSVDYVPLAPWAGVTLAGLALSGALRQWNAWDRLGGPSCSGKAGRSARFLGRHSLSIYLIHQPVLYGLVWLVASFGPELDRAGDAFISNCANACQDTLGTSDVCTDACTCTLEHLKADGTWNLLVVDPADQSLRTRMNDQYLLCLADPELRPPVSR
ncbi:MAG: heparan-alpha-glucosaminide N-acetyltransferase [Roseibium sp.]|uniref:heparan-alpha-glucosaminide N-acetyltransferase n=1 Tax=Roseibium sp. TaxID=1936156 RepID=UPI003D9C06EF